MGDNTFTAEVRKVDTEYGETGVGQSNRTETNYELGFEVGGAWVRVASVGSNQVDALVARVKDQAPPEPDGPTMTDVAPTPAPQSQAAGS